MEFGFTNQDAIYIYGTFAKQIAKLEAIKAAPNCPIDHKSIDQEIKLCASITDKIRAVYPQFAKMDELAAKNV